VTAEGQSEIPELPKKPRVRVTGTVPMTTWNLEDFIFPTRKKKPLQVPRATMPEPPEAKDLTLVQFKA